MATLKLLPTPSANDHIQRKTSKSWKAKGAVNFALSNPDLMNDLISSQEVFPASLFPKQVRGVVQTTIDIYGPRCTELFPSLDPDGSSLKMLADFLLLRTDWHSTRCYLTWKLSTTKFNRTLFQLSPRTLRTEEIGSGLLRAPNAGSHGNVGTANKAIVEGYAKPRSTVTLATQVAMLPTPRANERSQSNSADNGMSLSKAIGLLPTPRNRMTGDIGENRLNDKHNNLEKALTKELLPTPSTAGQSRDTKYHGNRSQSLGAIVSLNQHRQPGITGGANSPEHLAKERGHHDQLPNFIAMLPTPRTQSAKGTGKSFTKQGDLQNTIGTNPGLRLQPEFVEWMMGYPPAWTELTGSKPLATQSSRKSRTKSSKQSIK